MKDITRLIDEINTREGFEAEVHKDYMGKERLMIRMDGLNVAASPLIEEFKDKDLEDEKEVIRIADRLTAAALNGPEIGDILKDITGTKGTLLKAVIPCLERVERIDTERQVHKPIEGIEGMELVYRVRFSIPDPFEEPKGHPQTVEGDNDNPKASFILNKCQMEMLNITDEELDNAAWFNYYKAYRLEDFGSAFKRMFGFEIPSNDIGWLLLYTEPMGIEGSAGILRPDIMDRAKEMLGAEKLIILPSSKSEVIIMDYDKCPADKSELSHMVFEINMTEVKERERLIDRAITITDEGGFQMI